MKRPANGGNERGGLREVAPEPAGSTAAPAAAERRDRKFAEPQTNVGDFEFDAGTATVFDDMVERSVPFYDEIQRMTCEMAADFATPGSSIYDFGCATGTTLHALHDAVPEDVRFVGLDNSDDMLAQAKEKLAALSQNRVTELVNVDINERPAVENASVCLMLLTLQFVRPLNREAVMRRVFAGMREQGCLILVEKLVSPHSLLNRQFIKYYYALKTRCGYSEMEIAQKREALENVLVPYRLEENFELLRRTGFTQIDEFFRWYNFCGIVAIK